MKNFGKNRLAVVFAIGFCFIVFNSICFSADSSGVQQIYPLGSESTAMADKNDIESKTNQSDPTGHRQDYSYKFYPICSVYFDVERKLYYYPEDDNWKISASLPKNINGDLGEYVKIEMNTDKPYTEHDKHVKEFPPEQSGKTKKNIWSKLVFFLLYEHSSK